MKTRTLDSLPTNYNIIGNCPAMLEVYRMIAQVAASDATVLIRGASGTGKELVAQAIQANSLRSNKPFVVVNSAALPENLIESELFGHEKGSFTGAVSNRVGRIEAAEGGTLFLDEIGDLSLPVQVKLLRFLQERTYQRIGSNFEQKCNVRVLAATSRNLEELMQKGSFREDLYYRLNVFPIALPPLAKRGSDIELLSEFFLQRYAKKYQKHISGLSLAVVERLLSYRWPGNVRELENVLERAVLTATEPKIIMDNLPPELQGGTDLDTPNIDFSQGLEELVADFEKSVISAVLQQHKGNIAATARALKTTSRILRYKIAKLQITIFPEK